VVAEVVVAEGDRSDLPRACALWFSADEGAPVDEDQRRGDVEKLVAGLGEVWQPPPAHLLLATVDGELVGTVFGKPRRNDATTGQVSMLAVDPSRQRAGIGQRLLDYVLDLLALDGCVRCRIYVVESATQVRDFYEKRGWVFTGQVELSGDTGQPEMVYVKALRPSPG
jgi:ribosomal protein S18 acetylase RimI-like enzyme